MAPFRIASATAATLPDSENRDEGHAAVALAEPLEDHAAVFVSITEEVVENHELGVLARYATRQVSCTFHDGDGALFAKGFVKRRGDIVELTRRWVQNNYGWRSRVR